MNMKRLSEHIKRHFPFDIINFDPYGNFLKPDLAENKLCQSFERIFELQEPLDAFLMFITTPIFDIHPDFRERLKSDLESNAVAHPEIHDALLESVGTIPYDEIEESKKVAVGFAKSVVTSVARRKGWESEHRGIFVYEGPSRNRILNSVVHFSKGCPVPTESAYVADIVRVIQQMPEYCSHEDSLENQEMRDHLERVKEYREQIRDEYRE